MEAYPTISSHSNGAVIIDEIGSQTARLGDLQALVAGLLAEMASLSAELGNLKPPQEPADDSANAMRRFQNEQRRYQAQQERLLAKIAQVNLKLELASRAIAETEAKVSELQARLGAALANESRQLQEERAHLEKALKELQEMRAKLGEAARSMVEKFSQLDTDGRFHLVLVQRQVGIHLDSDGKPDGTTNAPTFILSDESAQRQMSRWTVDPLQVLPAGEAMSESVVARLSDATLDVARTAPPSDQRWELLRNMLLSPEHPGGFARPEVWQQMAAAMGVSERDFALRVLNLDAEAPAATTYRNEFKDAVAASGGQASDAQGDDFSWRLLAGYKLGDPEAFLRDDGAPWRAGLSADVAMSIRVEVAGGDPRAVRLAAQLREIAPNLSEERAMELAPHLLAAMEEAGIVTLRQRAAFIAQLAHESGGFKWFEELASGAEYEGRRDLGNSERGDGVRYKGRGPIQLTGRHNYQVAGEALGLPLEEHPEMAAQVDVGFRVAAWFWNSRGLNEPAERGDFEYVTRRINGGLNGYQARQNYYQRALHALDADWSERSHRFQAP